MNFFTNSWTEFIDTKVSKSAILIHGHLIFADVFGGISCDVGEAFDVSAQVFQSEGESFFCGMPQALKGIKIAYHPQV